MSGPVIHWFRQDLRLADNPALSAAARAGPVLCVYLLDEETPGRWAMGGASRWWLHHSLKGLAADIGGRGGRLVFRRGRAESVLGTLARETGAHAIHFTRAHEPHAATQEQRLKQEADRQGLQLRRHVGALLIEPERIATGAGEPYKVFTPFYKALMARIDLGRPLPAPERIVAPDTVPATDDLDDWGLLPARPDWAGGLRATWTPGEAGAARRLARFLDDAADGYPEGRDIPGAEHTSRLSPHLHFGEIGPRQLWAAARMMADSGRARPSGIDAFLRELAWREFCAHLLFHFPALPEEPFRPEFADFPWRDDAASLRAWQRGRTGYPLVDAGMRQLWRTGWMHNRVRMVAASFLTKHLLIPWQQGQAWFWDTLVDADLASNAANWQWVAGSGADAAPYFRIFNPAAQSRRFDPQGRYIRAFLPEIARLSDGHIHEPWNAPAQVMKEAGITLGETYPGPIVDHGEARRRALAAFDRVRGRGARG